MEKWVYNQCRFGLMAMAQTMNYVVSYDSGLVDIEKFVVRLLIFIEITKKQIPQLLSDMPDGCFLKVWP